MIAYELNDRGLVPAGTMVFLFIAQSKRNLGPIPNSLLPNDYWGSFLVVNEAGNIEIKNKLSFASNPRHMFGRGA
jgi:hypothetical protein